MHLGFLPFPTRNSQRSTLRLGEAGANLGVRWLDTALAFWLAWVWRFLHFNDRDRKRRQAGALQRTMKPRTLFLAVVLLCVAKTPAQNQTNTQPRAAPKQSEGGSTLNSPSAIAQRATADQSSTLHQPRRRTRRQCQRRRAGTDLLRFTPFAPLASLPL